MRKVKVYIACSLDGYIAKEDNNLDWLTELPNPDQSDFGYTAFYDSVDTVMMGRKTYNEVLGFDVPWPYAGKQTYVFSRSAGPEKDEYVSFFSGDLKTFVQALKKEAGKDIWMVGGGLLICSFLDLDLIDEMIISIVPTLLGAGLPLFPGHPKESHWELIGNESFKNGLVNLHYRRKGLV